ncbi:MAG TPA: hypothetical protein VGS06_41600, partial [Streptosporangiaceae bacterium]|nr:hypothetical protein [Streptosporangiaceae bacterium]
VTRTRWHRDPDATPDLPAIRRQIPHPPLTSGDSLHAYAIIDFAGALQDCGTITASDLARTVAAECG